MSPWKYSDGRGTQRRRPSIAGCAAAGAQAHPCEMSREAPFVEPGLIVVCQPRRQDLGFPCGGRRFKAFQLGKYRIKRLRADHSCFRSGALPVEQKTQEVTRSHRLALGAQTLDRVVGGGGTEA